MIVKNNTDKVFLLRSRTRKMQVFARQILEIPEEFQEDPTLRLALRTGEMEQVENADRVIPAKKAASKAPEKPRAVPAVENTPEPPEAPQEAAQAPQEAQQEPAPEREKKPSRRKQGDVE